MEALEQITFTKDQQEFICTMINIFGDGQHPYADERSFKYFTQEYVKELLNREKVTNALKPSGLAILEGIKTLFN